MSDRVILHVKITNSLSLEKLSASLIDQCGKIEFLILHHLDNILSTLLHHQYVWSSNQSCQTSQLYSQLFPVRRIRKSGAKECANQNQRVPSGGQWYPQRVERPLQLWQTGAFWDVPAGLNNVHFRVLNLTPDLSTHQTLNGCSALTLGNLSGSPGWRGMTFCNLWKP